MSILATITDEWSDGKRLHEIGTFAFSGNYTSGGVTVDFGIAGVRSDAIPSIVLSAVYRGYTFEYVPGTQARDGKLKVYGSGSAAATGVLTSDNTNVANNDTVTIGTQVYTFKTNLTATTTANEVLISVADADGSLTNLKNAINGTGTPGTDYGSLTPVNTKVTSSAVGVGGAHAITLTAIVAGTAANAVVTTETSGHLSFAQVTLTGGANETAGGSELAAAAFPTDLTTFAPPFYGIFLQFF